MKTTLRAVAMLAIASVVTACSLEPTEVPPDTEVTPDTTPIDTSDADTRPPVPDGGYDIGEACGGPNDCVAGASCIGNPLGEYRCMRNCEEVWKLCDDGSVCTPVANGQPVCYTGGDRERGEKCASNLRCKPGLLCVGVSNADYWCLDACHVDGDSCGAGEHCAAFGSSGKGYCRSDVGTHCQTADDCPAGLSCTAEIAGLVGNSFPNGYCTRTECKSDSDCPDGSHCRTYPSTNTALCFAGCSARTDCQLTGDYDCLDEAACQNSGGPMTCANFRGSSDICVPPALQSWSDD